MITLSFYHNQDKTYYDAKYTICYPIAKNIINNLK